jgi:hypothetical protein
MPLARLPIRAHYDAEVGLCRRDGGPSAFVICKLTFTIAAGGLEVASPEPLRADPRDSELAPRLQPGTEFWPFKPATDVVVQGSAFAPRGRPTDSMEASVSVGGRCKRVRVFGDRAVRWRGDGSLTIDAPEPFGEMPLVYQRAYGGLDWRVPAKAETAADAIRLDSDHPGLYPRNPFGRGYLVAPGEVPNMLMPNLEDPDDLLTADRLVVGDPKLWYRQPLPWCFDWSHPGTFPRCVFFGPRVDAWFPAPSDEDLPEVKRGLLPSGFRSRMANRPLLSGPEPSFFLEASFGMTFTRIEGAPVVIRGMCPDRPEIVFTIPAQGPAITLAVERTTETPRPRLHSVICRPAEGKVCLVYAADMVLPRIFIPGIHKHIPVSATILGDKPIEYEAPPTWHEQLPAPPAAQP